MRQLAQEIDNFLNEVILRSENQHEDVFLSIGQGNVTRAMPDQNFMLVLRSQDHLV